MVALAKRICSASQKRGTTCLTRFWESFGGSAVNCSLEPSSVQGNPTIALQLLPLHSSWIQTIDGTGLARMRLESLWKLEADHGYFMIFRISVWVKVILQPSMDTVVCPMMCQNALPQKNSE